METIKQNARVNDGGPISSRLLFEKLESCLGRKPHGVVKVGLAHGLMRRQPGESRW